jgi:hypothetical protein
MLSLAGENTFDLDSDAGVPYFQTNLADKMFRSYKKKVLL